MAGIYFIFKREVVYITARFKVTDEYFASWRSPRNENVLGFIVGDTERNELGKVVAEITGIESYKTNPDQQVAYESYNSHPDRQVVYLDIKFQAIYNSRKKVYTVRGKQVAFGETIPFYFSHVKFKGIVVDFPGFSGYKNVKSGATVVQAQLRDNNRQFSDIYGVPSYLAYAIQPGDTVVDSNNNTLAKVRDVQVRPAKRTVLDSYGNSLLTNDPDLKDVFYTIELSTKIINDKIYMFDYLPVEIGTRIPLFTKTVSVWPTITKILQ